MCVCVIIRRLSVSFTGFRTLSGSVCFVVYLLLWLVTVSSVFCNLSSEFIIQQRFEYFSRMIRF